MTPKLPKVRKFEFWAGRKTIYAGNKAKKKPSTITMTTNDLTEEQLQILFKARECVFHVEVQWRDWPQAVLSGPTITSASGDVTG